MAEHSIVEHSIEDFAEMDDAITSWEDTKAAFRKRYGLGDKFNAKQMMLAATQCVGESSANFAFRKLELVDKSEYPTVQKDKCEVIIESFLASVKKHFFDKEFTSLDDLLESLLRYDRLTASHKPKEQEKGQKQVRSKAEQVFHISPTPRTLPPTRSFPEQRSGISQKSPTGNMQKTTPVKPKQLPELRARPAPRNAESPRTSPRSKNHREVQTRVYGRRNVTDFGKQITDLSDTCIEALVVNHVKCSIPAATTKVIPITLNGRRQLALLDSGSSRSLLNASVADALGLHIAASSVRLEGANGQLLIVKAQVKATVLADDQTLDHPFIVVPQLQADRVLLGNDFLESSQAVIECSRDTFQVTANTSRQRVRLLKQVVVPPRSRKSVKVKVFNHEDAVMVTSTDLSTKRFGLDVEPINASDVGHCLVQPHAIPTKDVVPVAQRPRRLSPAQRDLVKAMIKDLVDAGLRKKDGSTRMCVDYRKLNAVTEDSVYPFPLIEDALQALTGCKYFSVMDLAPGFHQIPMKEEDIEKIAFVTPWGLYEYLRMPFGLKGAPFTCQREVDAVIDDAKLNYALVYMDDCVVYGNTFDEHLDHLTTILQRFKGADLKLKTQKCSFFSTKISYLGHVVTRHCVSPDPAKESVKQSPFFLVYGRDPVLPLDVVFNRQELGELKDVENYTALVHQRLMRARQLAAENIKLAQERQKSYFDRGRKDITFEKGRLVLLRSPPTDIKGSKKFIGPFRLVARLNPVNYEIELEDESRSDIVHVEKLFV
ncbi:uncharacterized protein LOC135387510 [Ornithodoros turicata]|uniref:uncharacterized protein LOC135387510 n=1 Tax=Ornithodoros turicata TaxID=34597 RepID=UPI00313A4A53